MRGRDMCIGGSLLPYPADPHRRDTGNCAIAPSRSGTLRAACSGCGRAVGALGASSRSRRNRARARWATLRYFSSVHPWRRQNSVGSISMASWLASTSRWSALSSPARSLMRRRSWRSMTSRSTSALLSIASASRSGLLPNDRALNRAASIGLRPEIARWRSWMRETSFCSRACAMCRLLWKGACPCRARARSSSVAWP